MPETYHLELRDNETPEEYVTRARGFDSVAQMRKHFYGTNHTDEPDYEMALLLRAKGN